MTRSKQDNEPDRFSGIRPNPKLLVNYYLDESQTSSYFSWQTVTQAVLPQSERQPALHLGKALAYGGGGNIGAWYQGDNNSRLQNFYDVRSSKGPGAGDIAHNFAAEWVYDTPKLSSIDNRFVRQIAGMWQAGGVFSAATGDPLGITQSTSLYHQRPDYAGQNPINENWRDTPTLQYLNLTAFSQVPVIQASGAAARPGTLDWGAVRGPGFWNLNLSLGKKLHDPGQGEAAASNRHVQCAKQIQPNGKSLPASTAQDSGRREARGDSV